MRSPADSPPLLILHWVFCHGWAYSHTLWERLWCHAGRHPTGYPAIWEPYRVISCYHVVDPYHPLSRPPELAAHTGQTYWIAVGHSWGWAHLVRQPIPWQVGIGIHAFTDFMGSHPVLRNTRMATWQRLQRHWEQAPARTLSRFYQQAGTPDWDRSFPEDPASSLLGDGLAALAKPLAPTDVPAIPWLWCVSEDDPIVPPSVIQDNWEPLCIHARSRAVQQPLSLQWYPHGKHSLPWHNPNQLWQDIRDFVVDNLSQQLFAEQKPIARKK